MDYLPTKFEVSGTKHFWLISCTMCMRLTWPSALTFDLVTWKSIGIIYSSRTIYLPNLNLLWQSVLELSVAQGIDDQYDPDLWPTDKKINRDHLLIMGYLPTKCEASSTDHCWLFSCTRYGRLTWPLTYWPEYQYGSPSHQRLYLPTKFEASGEKHSWFISCTRYGRSTLPLTLTYLHKNQ